MLNKKKIYAIIFAAVITVAILVPVIILISPIITSFTILSPTSTTYISQTTEININIEAKGFDIDMIWYRIYNETDGAWVDPTNITWTSSIPRILGEGGVYNLYAWANNSAGNTWAANVTFTMIHEIIYEGNHNFPDTFTVGQYQKVIFQNGEFSIATNSLMVLGILEIYNVIWNNNLIIDADSAISGTNVTFNNVLDIYGNTVASLNNVTFFGTVRLYDDSNITITDAIFNNPLYTFGNTVASLNNVTFFSSVNIVDYSVITVTDAVFNDYLYTYQSSKLTITDSSLYISIFYHNSEVNISYCSSSSWSGIYDYSIVTLRNFTTLQSIEALWNVSLTLINSSVGYLYKYIEFQSGDWNIDNNLISGSGTYGDPKINVIDSTIGTYYSSIEVSGSTKILINNSAYNYLSLHEASNVTIYNLNPYYIWMYGDSVATIINTTIIYNLWLENNGTVYLEDVSIDSIHKAFIFSQGDISGYNETFIGAESWSFPKLILGPNVLYNYYRYNYYIYNQVNLTLTNTSQIYSFYAYQNSNVSVFFCYAQYAYVYSDANFTTYYSDVYLIRGYNTANITLFNSTVSYQIRLYGWSFVNVLSSSSVDTLDLNDYSWYYKSADSTIDNFI